MKKFLNEFKAFISKGNVVDLAVGVIIGGAFQSIVSSLTGDIISPLLGLLAKNDLSEVKATICGVDIRYGAFITAVINFLIMAFVVFLFVKAIRGAENLAKKTLNKNKKKEDPPAPKTKTCPYCKSEINIEATRCPHCTSELK